MPSYHNTRKDSIDSTLETVKAIMESDILVPFTYTVYNDFSTEENTHRLEEAARQWNFRLVNLSDLTDHPSPNYLLVLQTAQKEAIKADAGLLIVESDVIVKKTHCNHYTMEHCNRNNAELQQL